MKKIVVTIISIIAMFCMQLMGAKTLAANIDEVTARQLGTYYLSVMNGGKVADKSQISLAYKFMNPDLNIPAAYVFNVEEQGYVIVSGSDLWYPILGYSTEGLLNVDKMAPAFKEYFDGLCEYIIYSQNTGKALITDIEQEWDELRYQKLPEMRSTKAEYWLMDSEWGQGFNDKATYNKYCPHKMKDGIEQYAYVGCVSTAMSQIMHYWKYPEEPANDFIGYDCYLDSVFYEEVNINLSDVRYDFDTMPNKLDKNSTEKQIDEVALLCYHAGVSVEMDYGLSVSLAYSNKVDAALRDVFLYDDGISYVERTQTLDEDAPELFTNEEWAAMLTEEIENGRPIYYSGYTKTGEGRDANGHAFVCDGKHPSNGKFHFNWGWDGQSNTWCDVRNNNLSVSNYNFKYHQEMVYKIQPKNNVGIDDIEMTMKAAYPNPATTQVTIPYDLNEAGVMNVYNVEGRLIESVGLNGGESSVRIDVSNYPKGLYICRLGASVQKFVVK